MEKVLMFVYDSFAEFEIAILVTGLSGSKYELVTFSVSPSNFPVRSAGNLKVIPDYHVDDINPDEYEAIIIPGGSPYPFLSNVKLLNIIKEFYVAGKCIAAICGGPALLGAAGVLEKVSYTASLTPEDQEYSKVMNWNNKLEELIVIDQNVITSTGSNYVASSEEVLRKLGCIPSDQLNPLAYFKTPSMG